MKSLIALCLFVTAGIGCSDSSVNSGQPPLGEIVFEAEYLNFAWGVSWNGTYVDVNGNVRTYDRSRDTVMWRDDDNGMFTEEELQRKYQRRDTLRSLIPADSLSRMKQMAQTIDAKTYSDTVSMGADMGTWTTSVYLYRPEIKKYQRIILSQDGDRRFFNTSANAKEISDWLKRIG